MAEFKLGRIRFVWKGDWSASNTYYQDDVVAFGGKTYICTIGHTSDTNFFADFNIIPPKWNLVSEGQTWKSEWTTNTDYKLDDIVSYGARLYIANTNHTSAATAVDASDGLEADLDKWDTFAEGLEWLGDWTTSTRYRVNDFVKYGGSTYVCNTLHVSTASAADGLENDIANWDLFNQGIEYKGEWTTGTRYKYNDLVRYGAGVWICTTAHTASSQFGTDNNNWAKFVEGFQYENDWNPFIAYQPGDVVRYGGNQYIANTSNIEFVPAAISGDISAITMANPAVVTSTTTHGLVSGRQIVISNASGMTEINNTVLYVSVIDSTNFELYTDKDLTLSLDSTGYTTYTGDGIFESSAVDEWNLFTEGFRFAGEYNEDSSNQHYKLGEVVTLGGYTYVCIKDHTSKQQPPNAVYWKQVNSGFAWKGEWLDDQEYYLGDVVRYGSNSYVCILGHISEGDDYSTATLTEPGGGAENSRPDLDITGTYWAIIAVGTEQSVLTTTGDLVYYSGNAPTRLPIGKEGQVLRVSSGGIPNWEFLQSVEDVYYVAEHGEDLPYPEYGSNIDRPFKSIRYATEQIEKGPKNPNAQYLLELNRVFIQEEVGSFINYQIANATPGSIYENFTYGEDKCKRDVGIILDKIKWDLGHGGNLKTRSATQSLLGLLGDGPYSIASEQEGSGYYPGLGAEADVSVAAYNHMLTLIDAVLKNEAPDTIYQNVTDDSTAIVEQYTNELLEVETGAYTKLAELVGIVTTAIASQSANDIPEREVPQTLVKVSTGKHYEVLPIIVPAYCAILGDELRSTEIIAGIATTPESDTANTVATFDRLSSVVSDIVIGTTVTATPGNNESQSTAWPLAITAQSTAVSELVDMMKYQIDYNLNGMTSRVITDPIGYNGSLENARNNLEVNRKFLIEEAAAYMSSEYPTLKYSKTKLKTDLGYILDALRYDLTYGGNAMSVQTGLAYYDGDDDTIPVLDSSIKTEYIDTIQYLKTISQTIAADNSVISPKQTTYTSTFTNNIGSITEIGTNIEHIVEIIDTGPAAVGTTVTLADPTPADGVNTTTALIAAYNDLDTNASTISTATNAWIASNYPNLTYNATKCARDVEIILKAVGFDFMFNSNYQTLKAAHAYLRETASEVYTLNQKTVTRLAIDYALNTQAIANVNSDSTAIARVQASADIIDSIIYSASNEGSVCETNDQNAYYAILQLERNREFIKSEISAWVANEISTATAGSIWDGYSYNSELCMRDVDRYIDALKYDLQYPGNQQSRYAARYYSNAVTGSQEEDMFYLRDATGVRNCTLKGLNGDLLPANQFGTSRPTAGAYCSLDPGFGPDDFKTWIITRSPYIQGVTTFGNAATGQRIDGALHNGGNDSMVSNDFTQVISDGIGAHILNNGRAELVSVFTYYSHIGYLAETGGRIRATNGNNSYGTFGSVAEGVDPEEIPVTAIIDNNTQYNATVSDVFTDQDQILAFEYGHAGNDYTEAVINVFGSGSGENIIADEFRDNALNYVLVTEDVDPDVPIGGSSYLITSNVAQSGSTTDIFLSATDGQVSSAYIGMKVLILGGAAKGQFGIIDTYNSGSKRATVVRESDGVAGWDHVVSGTPIVAPNSSSTYQIEPAVQITAPTNSNSSITMPTSTTWYDLDYVRTAKEYTGISSTGGNGSNATFDITRNGSKYYVTIANGGSNYERLDEITIAGTSVDGASPANDIVITVTTVNSTTGAVVDFDFTGIGRSGKFLAVGAGTNGAISVNGTTWTAEALPSLAGGNWASIATGLQDDGTSTFKPSAIVVVADGDGTVAYSDDADTWITASLPGSFNSTGENTVAFGQVTDTVARFIVISDADQDVAYSDNGGATWSVAATALPATGYGEMVYGAGKFVAINSGTTSAAYSTDGVSWTGVTAPATFAAVTDIVWGNGKFVALGGTNGIMYSLDGVTWYENALTLPLTATERKLAYGQGTFVITSDDTDQIQYSHDGLYWQSYTLTSALTGGPNVIAFGNPDRVGKFISIASGTSVNGAEIKIGAPARARASVSNEQVFEIRITEPGSGYTTAPTITIVDPNNIDDVVLVPQLGSGALGQPTFINRGSLFTQASAEIDNTFSNGSANFPQSGSFIAVRRLSERPVNGSNVVFDSIPGKFFKLVSTVSFLGTNDGSYTGFLQLSPSISVSEIPPEADPVDIRIRFSQVRLTGHDFLDIGTGGFTSTNYPNIPLITPDQNKETTDSNGGRVFYTSTDQDGNFRVGDLFTIEQSTGVATLNADAFNIAGLQELSLGEVTLGGNSATVSEFSTDPFFTANSDTVVPTQRAVKAYIESQIGGGGATLNVNSVTAGDIFIGANTITSLSGEPINIKANVVFSGTVLGLPLAYNYFLR